MRSWWASTQLATSRRLACSRIRAPSSGWRLISVPLVRVEPAGLEQHRVGDRRACRCRAARPRRARARRGRAEAELVRDQLGVAADGLGVAGGGDVAQVERLGQQHRGGELLAAAVVGERVEHLERLGVVDHAAVAAQALGREQRAVGGAHERLGVLAGRGRRRSPTETEIGTGKPRNSFATSRRSALGDGQRLALADAGEHERELLAAEPDGDVVLARAGAQQVGEAAEHVVAGRVPERVVDALEVVEVADRERDPAAPRRSSPVLEPAAVAQPGQRVVVGQLAQALELARGLDRARPPGWRTRAARAARRRPAAAGRPDRRPR